MAKEIFKSQEHQELFDRQGFIVLPFLDVQKIDHLNTFFDELHPQLIDDHFVSGSYSSDFEYKKKASDEIVSVFQQSFDRYFVDYMPFGGAFLYKTPGSQSALAPHQDWTIVDEVKDVALNCWVPLCDITINNGPLMILPGSHYSNHPVLRAPTLPFFFSSYENLILQELEPILVPAGTAVILNQSVIHYSPANTSGIIRKAITAGVKSAGAQMRFHYQPPGENKLEVYEQNDDFLIRFEDFIKDISERPKLGKYLKTIEYSLPTYSQEELRQLVYSLKNKAGFSSRSNQKQLQENRHLKPGFLTRLKSFFN
jgi:Phytanoyl-CoA dioxygenase (PhyH)